MGEYFNDVKLGTCEHLMYVRRQELVEYELKLICKENRNSGNLKYLSEYLNLEYNWYYRFPKYSEDGQSFKDVSNREPYDYLHINSLDIDIVGERYTVENPNGYTIFQDCKTKKMFSVDNEELEQIKKTMIDQGLREYDRIRSKYIKEKPMEKSNDLQVIETRGDQRESDWNFSRCMPVEFGMNDKKIRHYGLKKACPGTPEDHQGSEKPEI